MSEDNSCAALILMRGNLNYHYCWLADSFYEFLIISIIIIPKQLKFEFKILRIATRKSSKLKI